MQRILVIGSNGAGKSTFSYRLANLSGLPLIHLDKIYWYGNWQNITREQLSSIVSAETAKSEWIIDGSYIRTLDKRLPFADTVFWFEFPPIVCFFSILKRVFTNLGKVRPDMPDQCAERLDLAFLRYAWNFNRHNRERISLLLAAHPNLTVIRFTNRRQVKRYLASFSAQAHA